MGWNFRKSVKVFPGFKLNFSKSGVSGTVGIRGASVTVGPKGVYANASIPGTGIYKRQKISGRETSSKDNSNYLLNTDLNSKKFYITTYPLIFGDSIRMPVLRPSYYIPYILSLVLPIVALIVGFVFLGEPELSWWILPINIAQILCWWYCYKTVNWYFYGYEWYTGKLELEYKSIEVIRSHWKRLWLAIAIIVLNFITLIFAFNMSIEVHASFAYTIFTLVCVSLFIAWMPLASDDKYFAKEWDELIIPENEKADKERNFDNNLKFNNIIVGDYAKNYLSGGWVKVDEFGDYQVYFVQKDIVVHEVNLKCDCFIHCIGEKIGFIEVTHYLEKNDVENVFTRNERYKVIVENLYSLFVTKYGLPKENKVKYFGFRFTRTWNYLNQRVVFQHRIFEERTEESYIGVTHQVKINYVDNKLYKSIKDLWLIEYQKNLQDQMVKAEKKKEEQKLEAEIEEKRRKDQLQRACEQI